MSQGSSFLGTLQGAVRRAFLELDKRLHVIEDTIDEVSATIVTDHGGLAGLGDNDHPQYALDADFDAHLADTSDAHDASAISFVPTGTIASTDVQAAIVEVASETAFDTFDVASLRLDGGTASTSATQLTWDGGSS